MKIEDYLNAEYFKSRKQLTQETGLTDRAVRNQISALKKEKPVISNSQTKGYRLAKEIQSIETLEEAQEEKDLIQHCINDIESRKEDLNKSERSYIAYLEILEIRIMVLKNINHIPQL